ncbi:Zn-dependent metalloprotease [Streptomyces sp. SAI-041]|nr:Zn-dependent metalloprotease [Streptomyces sp. SAI-041]
MPLSHRALVRRRRAAVVALTAVGSLLGLAAPYSADAAPADPGPAKITATPRPGAAQTSLTPARRTALVKSAQSAAADTARRIGLGAEEKLVAKDVVTDADGTTHTRYERTFAGLPVLGGDLVVHDSHGRTTVTKANAARLSVPSLRPKVTSRGATDKALAVSRRDRVEDAEVGNASRLVVWAGAGKPVLAWETLVEGVQRDGTPSELQVVTDAATGKELLAAEQVHTGEGTGQYVGTVPLGTTPAGSTYQLVDPDRAGHKTYDLNQGTSGTGTLFTDDNDVWGNGSPTDRQTAGVDVAFGAAATWDFYKDAFGRNGIRNDGVAAYSRAHYGSNYVNAFWQDSCFCMTYGDGSGNTHPLTALDVAAHEMSHGVTAATAGLVYSGESGGLNEATSDIFAAAVEFHENLATDPADYLVGEKIDINGDGTPLRYMDKPSKDGDSRDSWSSTLGSIDVHYSSGPANHFFYLLSEGSGAKTVNGVSYDSPTYDGRPVTGVGIENAAAIWYRALTTYMTSTTDYAGARTATLSARRRPVRRLQPDLPGGRRRLGRDQRRQPHRPRRQPRPGRRPDQRRQPGGEPPTGRLHHPHGILPDLRGRRPAGRPDPQPGRPDQRHPDHPRHERGHRHGDRQHRGERHRHLQLADRLRLRQLHPRRHPRQRRRRGIPGDHHRPRRQRLHDDQGVRQHRPHLPR